MTTAAPGHEPSAVPPFIRSVSSLPAAGADPTGGLVAVAAPGATAASGVLRALHAAHVSAVPLQTERELNKAVVRLRPDLVVLDAGLCPTTILDVVTRLSAAGVAALMVVGELPNQATLVQLLRAGADDCLPSPYPVDELVARAQAVLRRTRQPRPSRCTILAAGSIQVDVNRHTVHIHGQPVLLTPLEFQLLACLLRHPGVVLSRQRLFAEVWGHTIGNADTVTVHVRRLREKIEPDPSRPAWIQTVWGIGYRFADGSARLT